MMTIHLLRHGAVENPGNVRYGDRIGFPLSQRGREQARLAAARLRASAGPIAMVLTSPLARAVETATIVRSELGLDELLVDDRLIEAKSSFDGLLRTAFLRPWYWPLLWNPLRPSWGEPFHDVMRRMVSAIDAFRAAWPDRAIVAVSHQSPIWLARRALAANGPPWLERMHCDNASITTLKFDGARYLGYDYWAP